MDILVWVRALFALVATLAMIGAIAWIAKRFGMIQLRRGATVRRMNVVERLALDPRRSLLLVQLDETEHLLLLSPAGDLVVAKQDALNIEPKPAEIPAPEEAQS